MLLRVNKYLSDIGVCSRRKADDLIKLGKVKVNDKVVLLGESIDKDTNPKFITIEGKSLTNHKVFNDNNQSNQDNVTDSYKNNRKSYFILNKPLNVLSSSSDNRGRKTVVDLVKSNKRLYPVGRLDYNSTGLIILTDDGDLAYKVTHPKFEVSKTYLVETVETVHKDQLDKLRIGVNIEGIKTLPSKVSLVDKNRFEISITQGIKRQIRLMCKSVGLNVKSLHRIRIGNLGLNNLDIGKYCEVSQEYIKEAIGIA